jgi:hypothetical protein
LGVLVAIPWVPWKPCKNAFWDLERCGFFALEDFNPVEMQVFATGTLESAQVRTPKPVEMAAFARGGA